MVFFSEKCVGYVMEEVGVRAVFVAQFRQCVFKGKLDGFYGIVGHVGGQRTDKAFEGGGEDVVLHTQTSLASSKYSRRCSMLLMMYP